MITGGTHGIGRATAQLIASLGGNVLVVGRNEENGRNLVSQTEGQIQFHKCDLSRIGDVKSLCLWIEDYLPKPHVLINSAARNSRYTLLGTSANEWREMLALNLTAPYLLCKAVATNMIRSDIAGKIINIGAVQAEKPLASSFSYTVVKGALMSMTKGMSCDLSPFGIQVMYLMVGPIYAKPEGEEPPPEMDKRAAPLLGRMGRKKEVAALLAFLASDYNTFMTGSVITIDGGRMISRRPDPPEVVNNLFDPIARAQMESREG